MIARRTRTTLDQPRGVAFWFIDGWYNACRRHSALRYKSPNQFEEAALDVAGAPSH